MLHLFPPTNHYACTNHYAIMPVLQQIRLTQVARKLQKVESSPAICNKSLHASCCAFYRSKCKANLLCSKIHSSRVWCNLSVILFNRKSVFTQFGSSCNKLICCKTGLNLGGKTLNIAFPLFLLQYCKTNCKFLSPLVPYL